MYLFIRNVAILSEPKYKLMRKQGSVHSFKTWKFTLSVCPMLKVTSSIPKNEKIVTGMILWFIAKFFSFRDVATQYHKICRQPVWGMKNVKINKIQTCQNHSTFFVCRLKRWILMTWDIYMLQTSIRIEEHLMTPPCASVCTRLIWRIAKLNELDFKPGKWMSVVGVQKKGRADERRLLSIINVFSVWFNKQWGQTQKA